MGKLFKKIKKYFTEIDKTVVFADADANIDSIQKGELAQRMIDNPIYQEIKNRIEQEIFAEWTTSPARDVEGRETLFHRMQALQKIDLEFNRFVAEAKYELKLKEQGFAIKEAEDKGNGNSNSK